MAEGYTIRTKTADGIDHGLCRTEYCLEACIDRFEDGYVLCPILWSGGNCEECMEVFEMRMEIEGRIEKYG